MLRRAAVINCGLVPKFSWSTGEMSDIDRVQGPARSFRYAGGYGPFKNLKHPFVVSHDILTRQRRSRLFSRSQWFSHCSGKRSGTLEQTVQPPADYWVY